MHRIGVFVYGVLSYACFFATFLYAIGFVGGFGVPRSIDSAAEGPLAIAVVVDVLLLAVFALQHSVMARPAFKRWWTRIVPEPAERSTYVLASSLALLFLFWQWRPIGGVVWQVEHPVVAAALYGLFAAGWLTVLVTTFLINHFDLFGLRQVWFHLRGRAVPATRLRHSGSVPPRAASALRRLAARLLGDADDDGGAPPLRGHDHGLHPDRDPARGAGPRRGPRRELRRVPAQRPDAGAPSPGDAAGGDEGGADRDGLR